jgi:hypothetical protein
MWGVACICYSVCIQEGMLHGLKSAVGIVNNGYLLRHILCKEDRWSHFVPLCQQWHGGLLHLCVPLGSAKIQCIHI